MRGIRYEDLTAMIDFFYHGEANVYQENLDPFLALAQELQLRGLHENTAEEYAENMSTKQETKVLKTEPCQSVAPQVVCSSKPNMTPNYETAIIALDDISGFTDLNQKLKSMMKFSENYVPGRRNERARICNICGKEDNLTNMKVHIEANHLNRPTIPCQVCGKVFKTGNSLRVHHSIFHKQ